MLVPYPFDFIIDMIILLDDCIRQYGNYLLELFFFILR